MDYILDENRLSNLIQKYITFLVGKDFGPVYTSSDRITYWSGKRMDHAFKTFSSFPNNLGINGNLIVEIKEIFHLNVTHQRFIYETFLEWFNKAQDSLHMDVKQTSMHIF